VGRGDHPQRTPVYGGALIIAAMILATVVTAAGPPSWVRLPVYLLCLVAALAGTVMTFRDWS
jgi:UDP-N-acetylmuramyl pentapeptide phosphotransferase/UDP-N-acetylglucosamine-1-phosphate transferase